MPWEVKPVGDRFGVFKKGSTKRLAVHATKAKAAAQVRALYANADGEARGKTRALSNPGAKKRSATATAALRKPKPKPKTASSTARRRQMAKKITAHARTYAAAKRS